MKKVLFCLVCILIYCNMIFAGQLAQNENGFYYVQDDGTLATSKWVEMDPDNDGIKDWYYFKEDGMMLIDGTTPDGSTVGSDGKYVQNASSNSSKSIVMPTDTANFRKQVNAAKKRKEKQAKRKAEQEKYEINNDTNINNSNTYNVNIKAAEKETTPPPKNSNQELIKKKMNDIQDLMRIKNDFQNEYKKNEDGLKTEQHNLEYFQKYFSNDEEKINFSKEGVNFYKKLMNECSKKIAEIDSTIRKLQDDIKNLQ